VINYDAPLLLWDYVLLLFYFIFAIILSIRKEKYFFEHPQVVNSSFIFSEGELIRDFNCEVARRRRDQRIVGIDRRTGPCGVLVSRCRRHHFFRSNVINERSPLISHWLTSDEGDDDVFESPESNSRYISRLSPESQERINAIQNFEDR
jgi:CRISPR/Cas system-associated protein Cas10 (large subunit of type III CRISPR-Cas system)